MGILKNQYGQYAENIIIVEVRNIIFVVMLLVLQRKPILVWFNLTFIYAVNKDLHYLYQPLLILCT